VRLDEPPLEQAEGAQVGGQRRGVEPGDFHVDVDPVGRQEGIVGAHGPGRPKLVHEPVQHSELGHGDRRTDDLHGTNNEAAG
jgi:hypothetical protein